MDGIQGLDKLLAQFDKLSGIEIGDSLLGGAYILQKKSQENAPVKTGFMRNSASSEKTGPNSAEMTFSAEYSYYVEQKHPYVRPAIDSEEKTILSYVKDDLKNKMKGAL